MLVNFIAIAFPDTKQLLYEVFVISRIINPKVELITLT